MKTKDENFTMIRYDYCEKHKKLTLHTMELLSGKENTIHFQKCCNECYEQTQVREKLALSKEPLYWTISSMPTKEWNFLVQNPYYIDP